MRYLDHVLNDGPTALWPCTSLGTSLRDITGHGHDMALTGYREPFRGPNRRIPTGYYMRGSGAAAAAGTTAAGLTGGPYTLELWQRHFGPNGTLFYVGNSGANGMGLYAGSANLTILHGGKAFGSTTYNIGGGDLWRHIMAIYDGSNYTILVNGTVVLGPTAIVAPNAPSASTALDSTSVGAYAMIATFNRALDPSRARSRYALGMG